jgi:N-acetylglucosaminyldiphosphoundecaprenol N-acetyl-beta-D-mannosaminyltransferase
LAKSGHKLFLLGGNPGVAEKAAGILQGRFPGLMIAGMYSPPFGFEKDLEQMAAIRSMLHDSRPDVVYVALGSPKQEILADQLRAEFPHIWWVGVGISLSFIAGDIHRAPVLLQRLGLEWIHRMAQEPRRLAKRYLIDGIPFGLWLMWHSWKHR